ncbi:MAG: guanylate kinase [Synergistaceae bacterium]|nr:guanylate kinase [Synergistaceae bacterium]
MKKNRGSLFVLSGPSGAGKGTLRKKIFESLKDIEFSVSCTTRCPRMGEMDGVDYRFLSRNEFDRLSREGAFLESAEVHGEWYGTLTKDVENALNSGKDILLEIDVQGALQIKKKILDSILLFVEPPDFQVLEGRLRERGTESEDLLQVRLRNARREIAQSDLYDHVVLNESVDQASEELKYIILGYRENEEEK